MPLSDNIKRLRRLRKISVKDLADQLSVSRQTIYDWESGKFEPSPANIDKLAEVLGVDRTAFYDEDVTYVAQKQILQKSEVIEMQKKYINMLEKEVDRYKRIVETLRLRLIDAGLDASTPD